MEAIKRCATHQEVCTSCWVFFTLTQIPSYRMSGLLNFSSISDLSLSTDGVGLRRVVFLRATIILYFIISFIAFAFTAYIHHVRS